MSTWDYTDGIEPIPVPDDYVWERLRLKRNALLAASDWTQVADAPVDTQAWAEYRQALRDIPSVTDDPRLAVWPVAPEMEA
jgi:hypothetical protein